MIIGDGDDSAERCVHAREILSREEVFLGGIEGVSSLMKDGNPEAAEIDVEFGAAGPRGDTAILQT